MKRLILLFALWAAISAVNAQIVQFGVTGDLAFDCAKSKYLENQIQPDKGWDVGVKLKVSTFTGIGFDLGVKYAQEDRGYWLTIPANVSNIGTDLCSVDDKAAFLSVPVNLRYDLKLPLASRIVIPFAFTGPEFNYTFDGIDWKKSNAADKMLEYVKENKCTWNYNFGFGVILFKRLEVAYTYTMRMTEPLDSSDKFAAEIESRYKAKKNKIGLTIYF